MALIALILNIFLIIMFIFFFRKRILNSLEVINKFMNDSTPGTLMALSMTNPDNEQNEKSIILFTNKWSRKLHNLSRLLTVNIYTTMILCIGGSVLSNHDYIISSIIISIGNILLVSGLLFYFLSLPKRFISEKRAIFNS